MALCSSSPGRREKDILDIVEYKTMEATVRETTAMEAMLEDMVTTIPHIIPTLTQLTQATPLTHTPKEDASLLETAKDALTRTFEEL